MKPTLPDREKLDSEGAAVEPGYAEWKRANVAAGLAQSCDRKAMIPVDQVWRDLNLER